MATRGKAQKTTAHRSAKKRERWTWNKESKHALSCLRELVATGKPLPDEIASKYAYAVEYILQLNSRWILIRSARDQRSNSIGAKIVKSLSMKSGQEPMLQRFRQAQESSRRASFDCVVRASLVSRGGMVSDDLNDAVLKREFIENPTIIEMIPEVLEWFIGAAKRGRSKFLLDLAMDMKNYDERKDKIDINGLLAEVARRWTDCHCPMWLMSRKAILKAAKAVAGEGAESNSWNEESLKRVFRDVDLIASDDPPIEDVVLKDGVIVGFRVQSHVFGDLETKVISFKPTGSTKTCGYAIAEQPIKARKAGLRVRGRTRT